MVSDCYRSKYDFWAQVSKITTTRLLYTSNLHTPLLAQTSSRKALRQLHLLEMDMFPFPGEPGGLSLGVNPSLTERWHTHSSPCQEPTSHSHSCLSLSAHIPTCMTVLPSNLKVTHLKFALLSSLHYQKALSTPTFILLWGLLLLSELLQRQDLDHLTSSLFTQSTCATCIYSHILSFLFFLIFSFLFFLFFL